MAKPSPLTTLHTKNGALFREDQGWILPLHWGNVRDEYNAIRSHVGVLDLCNRSLLRFTGSDRVSFLQGMVSNDVARLSPGHGIAAAVTDIQGKILADIKLFCIEDAYVLYLIDPLKDKIVGHLSRYLIADDVEITDLSAEYGILSIQGPKSIELLKTLLGVRELPSDELSHEQVQLDSVQIRIIRATHTGEPGFDLWVPAADHVAVAQSLQEKGRSFTARWIGTDAQEVFRIEEGIPRYGIDMDEQNILLETGLENAVSFDKGCYLGQEVIERIHSRGHVNKRLTGIILEGGEPAHPGDKLEAREKEVGTVTSSTLSPRLNQPVALAYIHRDYLTPGTYLTLRHNNQKLAAQVSSLPFRA